MNTEQQVMEFLKKTLPEMIAKDMVTVQPLSPEACKAFKDMLDLLNGKQPSE